MNTVALKNELAYIVCRYLDKHPHSRRMLVDSIDRGSGEYMFTLIFISAVKSAKGGKYPQFVNKFSELIKYLETRLCLSLDMRAVAKARGLQFRSKLNRLAILMAYLVEAARTGKYRPPEIKEIMDEAWTALQEAHDESERMRYMVAAWSKGGRR